MVNFRKKRKPLYKTKPFLVVCILVVLAGAGFVAVKTNLLKTGTPSTITVEGAAGTAGTTSGLKKISFKLKNERFGEYSSQYGSVDHTDLYPYVESPGHRGKITDLLFVEKGEILLSASMDNTVRAWDISDLRNPRPISTIRTRHGARALTLSPDRRLLAAAASAGVEFFDLEKGEHVYTWVRSSFPVTDIAFTYDGKYFVHSNRKGIIRVLPMEYFYKPGDVMLLNGSYNGFNLKGGHTRAVNALSMSKELLAAASDDGTVRVWTVENFSDPDSGPISVIDAHRGKVNIVRFSNSGDYLLTGGGDNTLLLFDKKGTLVKEFQHLDSPPVSLAFSPDDRRVMVGTRNDAFGMTSGIYTFPDGDIVTTMEEHPECTSAAASTLRENGVVFASGGGLQNRIVLWDGDGNRISTITSRENFICSVGFLKMPRKVGFGTALEINALTSGDPLTYLFDLKSFQLETLSREDGFSRARHRLGSRELSRDGAYEPSPHVWCASDALNIYSNGRLENIILRGEFNGRVHKCFTFVGDKLIASGGEDGALYLYLLSGEPTAKLIGHKGDILALAPSSDGKWLASVSSDRTVRVWDMRLIHTSPASSSPTLEKLIEKRKYQETETNGIGQVLQELYETDPIEYQALCYYHLERASEKFPTLTLCPLDMEWVAWTSEGHFTGSSREALKRFGFYVNRTHISYERLYDIYFNPSFMKDFFIEKERPDFMKMYAEEAAKNIRREKLAQALYASEPPKVEFAALRDGMTTYSDDFEVKINVTDQGGGIGDIRLYQNGKLVASEGLVRLKRWGSFEGTSVPLGDQNVGGNKAFYKQTGTVEKTYRIRLVAGENEVSCFAMNYKNTVSAGMNTVVVRGDFPESPPTLHILAIGILKFKEGKINLRYSHADVHGIATRLREKKADRYTDVSVTELLDPGKDKIIQEVSRLKKIVKPSDTFVLCISTHGAAKDDVYYLLTSDFDGVLGEDVCLTNADLMKISMEIPALHQVFILDACHAGTADFTFGDMYREGVTYFSTGSGVHLMAASAPLKYALEGYLGHGVFSYFLMMGLSGSADTDGDGDVTMKELSNYVRESVGNTTYGYQIPVVSNFGKDMVITQRR